MHLSISYRTIFKPNRQWHKTNFLCFCAFLFAGPFSAYEPLPGSGSLLSLRLYNRCPALSLEALLWGVVCLALSLASALLWDGFNRAKFARDCMHAKTGTSLT